MSEFRHGIPVAKVDRRLGLVFGWAIVCKKDGRPYVDTQKHHIPESDMLEKSAEFMLNSRRGGEMHRKDEEGNKIHKGDVVFCFPMTDEIAKAFGLSLGDRTGLMIAYKPMDKAILDKFESGEYTGFSIGGRTFGAMRDMAYEEAI